MKAMGFNIVIGIAILGNSYSAFSQAVVSLEAEVKNGVPIPGGPVATVTAAPGDVLELIFRVRSWGTTPPPNNLKGYQCAIGFEEFFAECSGNVLPVGFYEITDPLHVCPDGEPVGGDNFDTAYVDNTHPAFVFAGHGIGWRPVSTNTCNYRWACALLNTSAPDPGGSAGGIREYMATLVVRVSDDANGTFILNPNPDPVDGTFLRNSANLPLLPLLFEPCTIIVHPPLIFVAPDPPSGSIDARQPHAINDAVARQGWDRITSHVLTDCEGPAVAPADFEVTVEPPGGTIPQIIDITDDGQEITLLSDSPIPPRKWTRVRHVASGADLCLGFLPGDVNNDQIVHSTDVLRLIDHLNGVEDYEVNQTDIDRSGVTNPADVLRVIDLLNGADAFDPWNGRFLPPNPCY